jgi:uroporphyrinogen decarboxylase
MGFDVVCTRMIDSQTVFLALAEDPGWVVDMFNTGCDLSLALLDMIWEAGYHFDELMWYDDMAYKNGLLISKKMWRAYLRPYQQRMVEWAHKHGIPVQLHCCGNIASLIPELIDLGIDALNPMEVKAGMDPLRMKAEYGRDLVLRGGFDIQSWNDPSRFEEEIRTILPVMMKGGGYIFSSDHSIADSVSLENYRQIVELVKEIGRYEG